MQSLEYLVPNHDGWRLWVSQTWDPETHVPGRNPVLIVPGYGMNSFIFSFHPKGLSLEGYLVREGFEVWRADLRAQGRSTSVGGGEQFSLADLSATDLSAVIDSVLAKTKTGASRVDVIGASLGATIMFGHAALRPRHRMGTLVSLGGPLRWVKIHPAIALAFSSPALAGQLRFRGSRVLAGLALPRLARYAPGLLSLYLNPELTDTSAASQMVQTVEDPNRFINREIAAWMRSRDLQLRGVNVTSAVRELSNPLLTVVAAGDGIVPPETAEFPHRHVLASKKELLVVGDRDHAVAHADLFLCDEAQDWVFRPIASWLAQNTDDGRDR